MLIQKLRLKRGWSQQQLADASGLSARTIQRLEAGQPPSVESLKSIAAVFEIDFSTLRQTETTVDPEAKRSESQEAAAFRHVRRLRHFYLHLLRYVVIVLALTIINLIVTPHHLWVKWVVLGWGVGIVMHGFSVFRPTRFLGPEWERRQVEKHLGRSL